MVSLFIFGAFMKTCSRCKVEKSLDSFHVNKPLMYGVHHMCKECSSLDTKERHRTIGGLVKMIYQNQQRTTRKMNRPPPAYSLEELFQWMLEKGLEKMWGTWKQTGYDKWLSPSIDRLDNNTSYTLTNIRLVTWRENLDNYVLANHTGEIDRRDSKSVIQYTKSGDYVATFKTAAMAARAMVGHNKNVGNITAVCHGRSKTAYGYVWKFADYQLTVD